MLCWGFCNVEKQQKRNSEQEGATYEQKYGPVQIECVHDELSKEDGESLAQSDQRDPEIDLKRLRLGIKVPAHDESGEENWGFQEPH